MTQNASDNAPWYKQKVFWWLMSGPIIVVFAALITWQIALRHADDLVSDDYYKDGKHINLQIERDAAAVKRHISAQILMNAEGTAAKVFVSGDFDADKPLQLVLLHPAKKAFDQTVKLQKVGTSGDKTEYQAVFKTLPAAIHWYVRLEDDANVWRVESKWLPNQGAAINLTAKEDILPLETESE